MNFETQWQLDEFREVKDQYFDENNKLWGGLQCANMTSIMSQMLKLIDQLVNEVGTFEYEMKGLKEDLSHADVYRKIMIDAAGFQEQRAREAEKEIRNILNDIER